MTDQELDELKAKIKEADAEYHALMTGTKVRVFVDQNGERIEYTSANRSSLYNYIQSLKSQLPGATIKGYTAPIGFFF